MVIKDMAPSVTPTLPVMKKMDCNNISRSHTSPEMKTAARSGALTTFTFLASDVMPNDVTFNFGVGVDLQRAEMGHKRFPVLGPTRQDTEFFFKKGEKEKGSSTDDRNVRPGSSVRQHPHHVTTDHPPASRSGSRIAYSSDLATPQRDRLTREYLSSKPPHYRAGRDGSTDYKRSASSETVVRKGSAPNRLSTQDVVRDQEEPDGDRNSLYCVIRSAGNRNATGYVSHHGVTSVKNSRQLISNRSNQTYVITADTASLLLQSGPPFVVRSATELYSRQSARSAIQQVSDANRSSKSSSAHARRATSGFSAARKSLHDQIHNTLARSNSLNNALKGEARAQYRSHTQLDRSERGSSGSLANSHKYSSDDTLHRLGNSQNKRINVDSYLQNLQNAAELSYVDRQYPGAGAKVSSANAAFMRTPAVEEQDTFDPAMNSRILAKKLANSSSKASNNKNAAKTLSPSKYGYHPRSQSPTFKRLVAASEKLQETCASNDSQASPSESNFFQERNNYGSTSSDSIQGLRLYSQALLNGVEDSDCLTSDSSRTTERHHNSRRKQSDHHSRARNDFTKGGAVRQSNHEDSPGRTQKPRKPRQVTTHRRNVSYDRQTHRTVAATEEPPLINEDQYTLNDAYAHRMPRGDCSPASEEETRVPDVQPTQLHFFLPQLGDGMSEVSGPTLTGRSHYQERLELMNRREQNGIREEGGVERDNNNNNNNNNNNSKNNYNLSNSGHKKYQSHNPTSDHVSKSSFNSRQQRNAVGERGGRNASRERLAVRDVVKNGSLTPKDDGSKQKRYVSPVRVPQKQERQSRKKVTSYQARSPPYTYMDSQLPGERMKREVDDFPTLVSMTYSEPESPVQVR